jgi:hypothetical protein
MILDAADAPAQSRHVEDEDPNDEDDQFHFVFQSLCAMAGSYCLPAIRSIIERGEL